MGNFFNGLKDFLKTSSTKKVGTLAGSLVFFSLIGIVPITYIFSLVFSFLGAEIHVVGNLFSYKEFTIISNYLIDTALKLGAKGNIFAFCVALYSSANIFYHLKLSGQIIYNYTATNNIFVRIKSIIITFISVCLIALVIVFILAVIPLYTNLLDYKISILINALIAVVFVFILAIMVNFYICPFKLRLFEVVKGGFYTTLFCFFATLLFFVFIRNFANYDEIYGQIATIIVFLSWLYLMIKGFLDGVTINVYFMGKRRKIKELNKKNKV